MARDSFGMVSSESPIKSDVSLSSSLQVLTIIDPLMQGCVEKECFRKSSINKHFVLSRLL